MISHRLLPFLMALVGVGLLSIMDAVMKGAALAAGTYTATLLRSLIGAALIAPFWLARGWNWPSSAVLKLHIERGFVSALMALSWFYAITKLPLAEAIAISFIAPLLALYFARILLNEKIQKKAIYASVLGFFGTLVIVGGRFGSLEIKDDQVYGLAALLFSASLYAYNFIVIRRQSQVAGPLEIATFHSGIGGLILLLAAPFFWATPSIEIVGTISAASALTVTGAMAIAWAYARSETQLLVPAEYSAFLWAGALGWVFFNEPVTAPTMLGTGLIIAGCWIATRSQADLPQQASD